MKKILICTNHLGMLQNYRGELITELAKDNSIIIVSPEEGKNQFFSELGCEQLFVKMDRRGMNPIRDGRMLLEYWRITKGVKPDYVITYSIKPNIYMGLVCRLLGVKYYAHIQGLGSAFEHKFSSMIVVPLYRCAMKSVSNVFFENGDNRNTLVDYGIIKPEKGTVLPGAGVNLEKYRLAKYPENDSCHFLFSGRITKEKGIDELLSAVKKLHSEGESIVLDVAGVYEGNYSDSIQELQEQGICKFYGFLDDPRIAYEKADCVVIPSYHEGMCNVILEGAAMGRPVLTTDIPGCREGVVDCKTGYLCKPKDADDLYSIMKKFLTLNKEERSIMGLEGRKLVERTFDRNIVVRETMDVLSN